MRRRLVFVLAAFMVAMVLPAATASAHGEPALEPALVTATVADGGSFDIAKTVHTPEIPPNPAIVFLADTTGSMGSTLANVAANGTPIMNAVLAAQPSAVFGAAQYRDSGDSPVFAVDQALTATTAAVQTAMDTWSAGGGGDTPEAQLNALTQLASGAVVFPTGSTPIIVWFGDASGHDPSFGATLATTIADLQSAGIAVIAVDVVSGGGDGLNATGQATAIAGATGGVFLTAPSADQTAAAITAGLSNLPAEVSMTSDCASATGGVVDTAFDPAVQTVTSGDDALFTETITVAAGAEPGVYECDDWALINGDPMTDADDNVILEHKTITVATAFCVEGVNPAGRTPKASRDGHNEDGFFKIGATPDGLEVTLTDDGSGTVFGPFPSGTNVKYTQNDDDVSIEPGSGQVIWKIKGLGDATVTFTDEFGNTSTASCLVPRPPK